MFSVKSVALAIAYYYFAYCVCLIQAQTAEGLFVQAFAEVRVQENVQVGTVIYTASVTDIVELSIAPSDTFEIDTSGQVFTVESLDCEVQSKYELVITAVSLETNVSDESVLNVTVRDVNDNSPVFRADIYSVDYITRRGTIFEPDRVVVQVRADDADCSNAHRQVTYSVPDDAFGFAINATSGELYAPVNITSAFYIFNIFATDSGGLNGTVLAVITLTPDCGPVPNIINGLASNVSSTLSGSRANVTCAAGYNTSTPVIQCTSEGTWESATCIQNVCPDLEDPQNGTVSVGSVTVGSIAEFGCDAGFDLIGRANLTCLDNGTWDSVPPECTIKDCGTPPSLANGNFTTDTGDTIFGTTTTYRCYDGYDLEGSATTLCLFNSTWEQSQPFCRIKDCGQLGSVPRVRRQTYNDNQLIITSNGTTFGSIATFNCNPGYTLSSNQTLYCTAVGQWNGSEPTCNINDCGNLQMPSNGTTILNNDATTFGSIATFECDTGFTISEDTVLECEADGQWNGTEPTCDIIDCGDVETPYNGSVILNDDATTFGSTATFECDTGFTISEDTLLECEADGQWNGTEPTCDIIDCGDVETPYNGSVILNDDATTFGSTATFECDTGFTISEDTLLECEADGQWNGTEPTCDIIDCGDVETPYNGSVILNDDATTFGSTATFECDTGFTISEDTLLECEADGQWNGTEPTCDIIDCGDVETPYNGSVILNDDATTFGSTATFECDTGFTISEDTLLECEADGQWNGTEPTCDIIDCGDVETPYNGSVILNDDATTFGSTATLECDTGFTISEDTLLECEADGQWNGTEPTCDIIDCGDVETPYNGSVILNDDATTFGSTATFECDTGFTISEDTLLECEADGQWNGTEPTCDIIDCGDVETPYNGSVILNDDATTFGSTVTFECDTGFTISEDTLLECEADGQWNGTEPTCDIIDCGDLETSSNGSVILNDDATTFGSVATFECDTGFKISENTMLKCESDGQWNGTEPTCDMIDCGVIESPNNGSVIIEDDRTTYGSSATFECNTGYRLSKVIILNCTANGEWDGETPTCVIKDCSGLPVIDNGSITYQNGVTTVGSIVTFECNAGYNISNKGVLWCQQDGTWNGSVPKCQIKDCGDLGAIAHGSVILGRNTTTYGSNATFVCEAGYTISDDKVLICNTDGQWNGTKPSCELSDCGNMTVPDHGYVSFQNNVTTVGSTANFSCNAGYDISGTDNLYCNKDGTWNGTVPTCVIKDCGSLTLGDNISVTYTNDATTFGSLASFTCNAWYKMTGNPVASCTSDGTWNDTVPTCSLKDCGSLSAPQRGTVTTPSGTLVNATATYACGEDFTLIGDTTRTCLHTGKWSGNQPSCVRTAVPVTPCPANVDIRGTRWSQSVPNQIRQVDCPDGFTGNATRRCNIGGSWDPPKYDCIREKVRNIKQQAASLNNASTPAEVEQVLTELLNVTLDTTGETVAATEQLTDGELVSLSDSFGDIADVISEDQVESVADSFITTASNLIDDTNRNTWINLGESEGVGAERVISAVDTVSEKITGKIRAAGGGQVVISRKNIAVEVRSIDNEDVNFPYALQNALQNDSTWQNLSASASIPKEAFQGTNVTTTGVIFRNMSAITRGNKNSGTSNAEINGPVVAMTVRPKPQVLDPPLTLVFPHSIVTVTLPLKNIVNENVSLKISKKKKRRKPGRQRPACSFWNITESRWSTSGCVLVSSNDSMTVCECDHLTNFAVLMSAFVEADSESTALRVVSIVGIGISIICLILTLATHFCLWRYLRNDRTTILVHLCVALLASYIIFLAGVDRTESRVFCAIVAVLLQYIYLVVFCVMLAEGIEIGITVLFVFVKRSRIKPLLIGAWVIPAIIVAISLGVTKAEGYGNDNFCWLSIENGLIWAFIGPALAIILFNLVILMVVIKVMFSTKAMEQKKKIKKVKTGLRSLGVLIPLMGVTWIIGIFYVNEDFYWIQYVFSICNGLQGFFIFLFHCVFNPQIKSARKAKQRRKSSTSLKSTMRTTFKSDSKTAKENSSHEHSNTYLAKSISEDKTDMLDNPYKLGRGSGGVFDKRSPKIAMSNGSNYGFDISTTEKDA